MKLLNLVPPALIGLAATASCSQEALKEDPTGGTSMGAVSGSGQPMMGGTTGMMGGTGNTSMGGTGGSTGGATMTSGGMGGTMPTMGGTTNGGTSGGVPPAAGTSGSSGAPPMGGSSGAPPMGGTAGMGAGGLLPMAGMSGSGMTSGGMAGMLGMAGGGGGGSLIDTVAKAFDGFYWEGTCSGNVSVSGKNCPIYDNGMTSCPSGGSFDTRGTIRSKSIKMTGTPGQVYTINFEVRGIAGTRCYTGGTPGSTATPTTNGPNNGWYVGGTPSSKNSDWWNTYELHVESPTVQGEANTYYLNGFPENPDWCTREATFPMGYSASFKVMGDSTLRFAIHDSNCQAQQNCGPDEASTTCTAPKNVNVADMDPPGTFAQPPVNTIANNTFHPQWLYFDVKSVTAN